MDRDELLLDMSDRLARVEVKVDALLEKDKRRFDLGLRTWLALIGSVTAIIIALIK